MSQFTEKQLADSFWELPEISPHKEKVEASFRAHEPITKETLKGWDQTPAVMLVAGTYMVDAMCKLVPAWSGVEYDIWLEDNEILFDALFETKPGWTHLEWGTAVLNHSMALRSK